jgi:hypothetical protein
VILSSAREIVTANRRSGIDRRAGRRLPRLFVGPRRRERSGRRSTDREAYVDRYDAWTWAVAISVVILSILDAVLTSLQISAGRVREANPVMHHVLEIGGPWVFFGLKAALTSLAMAAIVLHKEWKMGRAAARVCLWAYILICSYHLVLILSWPQPPTV